MSDASEMPEEPAPDARLWQRWRQGECVDVVDFLAGFASLESVELVAVLLVDQRERWQVGERIPAETYLRRFPALEADGVPFFSLAFCPGGGLDRKLAGKALPPREAVDRPSA
jgi:hypothetical protein